MTTENSRAADEAWIRELIKERVRAIRAKDVDALIGTPAVLGNPAVIPGIGVTHLRYPVRKAWSYPTPFSLRQLITMEK